MNSLGLFSRTVSVIISAFCLLFLIGAPLAHAQSAFSYPPFPTTAATGLAVNPNASVGNGNLLTLTPALGSQVGSAWYTNPGATPVNAFAPSPLSLLNGFTTTFTFQLSNQGGIAGTNGKVGADGIAFIIQNGGFSNGTSGAAAVATNTGTGGEIGFNGLTHSLAIQFDTWCNSEYHDSCAGPNSPTSADQLTIESCGANPNTVNHSAGCSFGTVPDLSALTPAINLGDGHIHTAQITYVPPANPTAGNCPIGSASTTAGCGSLIVVVDGQTLLTKPFNLAYLGLDTNADAFAGFAGATGGSFELQNVLTWNFSVTQVQPFNTSGPTTANFSSNGSENQLTFDATDAANNLICQGQPSPDFSCTDVQLLSSNDTIPTADWPQYVVGGPWAPTVCAARPANGANVCTLYVNACYGGTNAIPLSAASDFYCPAVSPTAPLGTLLTIEDVFDPPSPKLGVIPGTTVALLDFTPATPTEVWAPSSITPPLAPNPVCTNPFGTGGSSPAFQCDVADTLVQVFGDQTTTKGSKPKKGWVVTVFNVPMLQTTWNVISGGSCPTATLPVQLNDPPANTNPSAAYWFNENCVVQFTVNPATVPDPNNSNGFVAAPPALLSYGLGQAVSPVLPPTVPVDVVQTNSNLSKPASAYTFSPGTLSALITSVGGSGDGTYILHWSAQDLVGDSEKNVQLLQYPETDTPCLNGGHGDIPNYPTVEVPACYTTNLFTATLNLDSVMPTASCTAPSTSGWYKTDIIAICSGLDDRSGIGSATPGISGVSTSTPVVPPSTVGFNLSTTVSSTAPYWSTSAYTGSQQICDLANNCFTEGPLGPYMIDEVPPTVSSIVLSPGGGSYTVGQKVTATFSCGDVGSGVATCLGTGGVGTGGYIDTSSTGPHTFTVTATDVAGNVTTNFVNYTVSGPSADVALFEQPGSATHGTTFNAVFWALDLSSNAASNVTINANTKSPVWSAW